MVDSNEIQPLDKLRTEVDEAQKKATLATQCYKAQIFLYEKLKKQKQRVKDDCTSMSNANMKLQSEITQAEQEIKSLQIAKETIRTANVQLQREWLVAKVKREDVIQIVQKGEKKYEQLWLDCKSRYESLPFVQNLLKAVETAESLKDKVRGLENQAESLHKDIKEKKESCLNLDKKRIIQLAEFMVYERPKIIEKVNEKSKAITDLTNELKQMHIKAAVTVVEKDNKIETRAITKADEIIMNTRTDENALIMPKMHKLNLDDLISVSFEQVQMRYKDCTMEKKEPSTISNYELGTNMLNRKTDVGESIASYFPMFRSAQDDDNKTQNYSKKKLINILQDVKIDDNDAINIISKVYPGSLHPVENISAEKKPTSTNQDPRVSNNADKEHPTENIEEIDMPSSNAENIVQPPTQFLDGSLKMQGSQESKKAVTFSLTCDQKPESEPDAIINDNTNKDAVHENDEVEANNSQLDVSAVSDDGFTKIKDMVLKKHKLDLSPQFVYAKNTMLPMQRDEAVVTSKFFKKNDDQNENITSNDLVKDTQGDTNEIRHFDIETGTEIAQDNTCKVTELEDDEMDISSPKKQKIDELSSGKPFSGYLFKHGPQGLPESLDVSINTTGYDDGDADFHLDSSLLLSPKADVPMSSENPDINSQTPSFLSGFRKTDLSFFGHSATGDPKPDGSGPSQGNSGFSFNFGGDKKKNRGGLFSMFQ